MIFAKKNRRLQGMHLAQIEILYPNAPPQHGWWSYVAKVGPPFSSSLVLTQLSCPSLPLVCPSSPFLALPRPSSPFYTPPIHSHPFSHTSPTSFTSFPSSCTLTWLSSPFLALPRPSSPFHTPPIHSHPLPPIPPTSSNIPQHPPTSCY